MEGDGGLYLGPAFPCSSVRYVGLFAGPTIDAGYGGYNWVDIAQPDPATSADAGWDEYDLELYSQVQMNAPVPGVTELDGGTDDGSSLTYGNCGVCPMYFENCTAPSVCERAYLGVSGHVDVKAATQGAPGSAYAESTNVAFVEWDFGNDAPATNSRCIVVASATHDGGWL